MQAWQHFCICGSPAGVVVVVCLLGRFGHHHSINRFKLHNAASPDHNLTEIFIPTFDRFQYDIEKGIVAAQRAGNGPIAVQGEFETLVLFSGAKIQNKQSSKTPAKRNSKGKYQRINN
jgi:hypothetical protein